MNIGNRRRIIKFFDQAAITAAVLLGFRLSQSGPINFETQWPFLFLLLAANFLWVLLAEAFDSYERENIYHLWSSITSSFIPFGILSFVVLLPAVFIPGLLQSVLPAVASAAILVPLSRTLAFRAILPRSPRHLLFIGDGNNAEALLKAAGADISVGYRVLGYVNGQPEGEDDLSARLPFLGSVDELDTILTAMHTDVLVLADGYGEAAARRGILGHWMERGIEIVPLKELYSEVTGRVPIDHIGDESLPLLPLRHPANSALYQAEKRLIDIVLASLGLICLAVAIPFIALAIYIESPGPIFYLQKRVGKGGRIFNAYKFRSMVPNAETNEAVWAEKNDSRVTSVGRLLRKTHVDEFPQFVNILKGEMSAVGPRPERPEFVTDLEQEIPLYRARHAVKPGMAGWGLVKQGYASSWEDTRTKLEYDLFYIQHQSLRFDFVILAKTFVDTFAFRGQC